MNRVIPYFALIGSICLMLMGSCCGPKYICSAYQSSFFLDKTYGDNFFTAAIDADSMPLVKRVAKTDYLLIKPMKAKKKEKGWAVVPMITIFPPIDSSRIDSNQKSDVIEYEEDEPPKTNFLEIPGETPRQKRRREKKEAKEKAKKEKEAALKKPEEEVPAEQGQ
jgi:hypothetical protein